MAKRANPRNVRPNEDCLRCQAPGGVAATQFTAYMALLNFVIWYSSTWRGWAIERWGYLMTLLLDALFGLVCLGVLPWIRPVAPGEGGQQGTTN